MNLRFECILGSVMVHSTHSSQQKCEGVGMRHLIWCAVLTNGNQNLL